MAIGLQKASALVKMLIHDPGELSERSRIALEGRLARLAAGGSSYQGLTGNESHRILGEVLGGEYQRALASSALAQLESSLAGQLDALSASGPFSLDHNADWLLARTVFGICRALRPQVVVETGVAYGVTSAFILLALKLNARGSLHSIDLPPLASDADESVGALVPAALQGRWHLHRGSSRRVMPSLLANVGPVDVFIHDSLHTYWNMKREFTLVSKYLASDYCLVADDIQGNDAFAQWIQGIKPDHTLVVSEEWKDAFFGVGVASRANSSHP
jgi:hypothetical protein